MGICMLCAREDKGIRTGSMALCARCHKQVCALRPEEGRYLWYMRAVRRAQSGQWAALRKNSHGKILALL